MVSQGLGRSLSLFVILLMYIMTRQTRSDESICPCWATLTGPTERTPFERALFRRHGPCETSQSVFAGETLANRHRQCRVSESTAIITVPRTPHPRMVALSGSAPRCLSRRGQTDRYRFCNRRPQGLQVPSYNARASTLVSSRYLASVGQFWQMKSLAQKSFQISQDYYPET